MELSEDELVFAILDESHKVACRALVGPILKAVKTMNPHDWIKKIRQGFTASTRPHLDRCLKNNQPLADVYVVCKLIKCNINDIANFHGGILDSPNEKERLSLHAQGVAAARNWLFHGEAISAGELCSNVRLLLWILNAMRCEVCFIETLSKILNDAEKWLHIVSFHETIPVEGFTISHVSTVRALFYDSLKKFEMLFAGLFKSVDNKRLSNAQQGKNQLQYDIFSLAKRIKMEIHKPKSDSLLVVTEHNSRKKKNTSKLFLYLQNVLSTRNMLAHGEVLGLADVKDALENIAEILSAFGLSKKTTWNGLEKISLLAIGGSDKGCRLRYRNQDSDQETPGLSKDRHRMRLLRPKCLPFVGRRKELDAIATSLEYQDWRQQSSRLVLILGPAGVGKSYLATEAASVLAKQFFRQVWLCCSTERELREDMTNNQHVFANCPNIPFCDYGEQTSLLLVFDNVSSSTVDVVHQRCKECGFAAIITTRCSSVKYVFQRIFPSLKVIPLHPFSEAESLELISEKISKARVTTRSSSLNKAAVTKILGNLPLCVAIYSSFLAYSSSHTTEDYSTFDIDSSTLKLHLNWGQIEEQFGDRFHVRGLTGVVKYAEMYLEDSPLLVLLLAKICLANSEYIPWEIVRMEPDDGLSWAVRLQDFNKQCNEIFSCLLGVTDYLFSENGQTSLDDYRSSLEEMGLISWDDQRSCVHVHLLTIQALQDLLARNALYLPNLISAVLKRPIRSPDVINSVELVYPALGIELIFQVLIRSINILHRACRDENFMCGKIVEEEQTYRVFTFLSRAVHMNIFRILETCDKMRLKSCIVSALVMFSEAKRFVVTDNEVRTWKRILQENPLDEHLLDFMTFSHYEAQACTLHNLGRCDKAALMYEKLLNEYEHVFGAGSYKAALFHCYVAANLTSLTAQKAYLWKASRNCPKLIPEPTVEGIRNEIAALQTPLFRAICDKNCLLKSQVWFCQVSLQANDSISAGGMIAHTTVECALEIIKLFQILQEKLLKEIEQQVIKGHSSIEKRIYGVRNLITYVAREQWLHEELKEFCSGHALKVLLRACNVIEEMIFPYLTSTCPRDEFEAHYEPFLQALTMLTNNCCTYAFDVGHFSLARGISNRIAVTVDSLNADYKSMIPGEGSAACLQGLTCFRYICNLSEGLHLLYTKGNLQFALAKFSSVVQEVLAGASQFSVQGLLGGANRFILFKHFVLVKKALARHDLDLTVAELSRKLNVQFPQSVGESYSAEVTDHDHVYQMHHIYNYFVEAKNAFETESSSHARNSLLKFWRGLAQNSFEEFSCKMYGRAIREIDIFVPLCLRVAGYLKEIYCEGKRYQAAEWFLKFRVQCAQKDHLWFLEAKYRFEYVEFLQQREQWSDALRQYNLLDLALRKNFGDDYLQWLPEAPNITLLHQIVQSKMETTVPS